MTEYEFERIINFMGGIWGAQFDQDKTQIWFSILGKLKPEGLLKSLQELALEKTFPPSISEIAKKYDELKKRAEAEKRQQEQEAYDKHIKMLTDGQHYCYICGNIGLIFFDRDGYEYVCRCSCARGKSGWSRYQITPGMMWKDPNTGKEEDIYMPEINDLFTEEEIEIIKLKNSGDKMERAGAAAISRGELLRQATKTLVEQVSLGWEDYHGDTPFKNK